MCAVLRKYLSPTVSGLLRINNREADCSLNTGQVELFERRIFVS